MKAVGILDVYLKDAEGNILQHSQGKNIIFDDARYNVFLNPSIIDGDLTDLDFQLFLSETRDLINDSYFYWDSSILDHYTTTTLTRTYETLDASRRMYTFTGAPVLPGGVERTLRVVGLFRYFSVSAYWYYPDIYKINHTGTIYKYYASAITLDTPILHTVSTYITAYYKVILGYGANTVLYGNIWNWIQRNWYNKGWGEYKRYYNCNDSGVSLIPAYTTVPNTLGAVETLNLVTLTEGFQSGTYTKTFLGPEMLTGIAKDGEMAIVMYNNGYNLTYTQTFLHTSLSSSFYADLLDNIPSSTGSVRFELDEVKNPLVVSINITKGGAVGVAEYDIDIYHGVTTESSKYAVLQKSLFTMRNTNGYYSNYVSKNREWMVGVKYGY